ncbi:MAG TPA: methyltransferase domain-containing protein [Xanthobacteraceae bacterium]|nr:methyltransferase domain-containing protein [Xanthobacteraceae bacterium]
MRVPEDSVAANAYDQVRYPGAPQSSSHPARMSALACLYGRSFVSQSQCRVLEAGCGDGTNLLSMAATAPQSRFVGFDLAESAIEKARATAATAGLTNVEFSVMDIEDASEALGEFDYIIAHGVYAWVPAPVRDALMRLIGRALTPSGLAFVSYNAMPASRMRQIVRDILRDRVHGITDVAETFAAAKECMEFHAAIWSQDDALRNAMREQMLALLQRPPEVLFHDEMGEIFEPQFVSRVAAHAETHGLQYLCDCSPGLNSEAFFPSVENKELRERAHGDWVRYEQLHDYVKLVRFRQTILCRDNGGIDRRTEWTRVRQLHAQGRIVREEGKNPDVFVFRVDKGEASGHISTNDAELAALISRIGAADPGAIPLENAITSPKIAEAILRLFLAGSLSLQTERFAFTLAPCERPATHPLLRAQVLRGEKRLASLRHTAVDITDPESRHFIGLLDGTRTRSELATEMARFTGVPTADIAAKLDDVLNGLARSALLVR